MSDTMDKGEGRGKGKWTARGVQAQQNEDIEELKSLVAEMAARLDELEAGNDGGDTTGDEPPA